MCCCFYFLIVVARHIVSFAVSFVFWSCDRKRSNSPGREKLFAILSIAAVSLIIRDIACCCPRQYDHHYSMIRKFFVGIFESFFFVCCWCAHNFDLWFEMLKLFFLVWLVMMSGNLGMALLNTRRVFSIWWVFEKSFISNFCLACAATPGFFVCSAISYCALQAFQAGNIKHLFSRDIIFLLKRLFVDCVCVVWLWHLSLLFRGHIVSIKANRCLLRLISCQS